MLPGTGMALRGMSTYTMEDKQSSSKLQHRVVLPLSESYLASFL